MVMHDKATSFLSLQAAMDATIPATATTAVIAYITVDASTRVSLATGNNRSAAFARKTAPKEKKQTYPSVTPCRPTRIGTIESASVARGPENQ
jgi:hypothetical protein